MPDDGTGQDMDGGGRHGFVRGRDAMERRWQPEGPKQNAVAWDRNAGILPGPVPWLGQLFQQCIR